MTWHQNKYSDLNNTLCFEIYDVLDMENKISIWNKQYPKYLRESYQINVGDSKKICVRKYKIFKAIKTYNYVPNLLGNPFFVSHVFNLILRMIDLTSSCFSTQHNFLINLGISIGRRQVLGPIWNAYNERLHLCETHLENHQQHFDVEFADS